MVKIIVGSKNPVKINSVKRVFSKYFDNLEVRGEKVDSKVSYQPKSEKETIQGAKNRAEYIFKKYKPDFALGIEGGLGYLNSKLYTFAWVCIESKEGKIGLGRTASFPLPQKMEKLINDGKELGEADDIIFRMKNTKQKMGAIGLLSKEVLDRTKLYEQGVICALLPFINKELYNK
ncbi:inosine/xanthosine triphosphatase [bacterium (Candidatus Gribaldobacteria) CG_4_9_14_3_um_filter_36_15]|uniref:Probable inosine/xanthosine triphosphatase n=2 Tax=Candidatus Gribaldobacteria TaxID=2798536 RepID=A0A2M7VKW1_9BACT|nr:MAG: inosine/xanthosine triphosphatase [bacterium (Candidatus Gribaldobacteria) CG_4_10_14_0_2_um_filter_36_18]PJB09350.1 MAG: inosine/xanthosine triphosphatase [bacterium (Candidatus Gribaldobacteria) CG_4_9_14_3_um_filter_36_15]